MELGLDERYSLATIYKENKTQVNVSIEISYDKIWKSKKSGQYYPRSIDIFVPTENIELHLELIPDNPEFYRENGGICGCQSLCRVTGHYGNIKIDRRQILEIIGDLCGDI